MRTIVAAVFVSGLAACGSGASDVAVATGSEGPPSNIVPPGNYRVFAANDLGMHCMDREFSMFSILPPFNVLRRAGASSAARRARRACSTRANVDVTYERVADATRLDQLAQHRQDRLLGARAGAVRRDAAAGQGLTGLYMPRRRAPPGPQALTWTPTASRSSAPFGIPITPIDDAGTHEPVPAAPRRAPANAATGAELATLDIVVPVARRPTAATATRPARSPRREPGVTWSTDADSSCRPS